jgi:uncharacterized membrane protein
MLVDAIVATVLLAASLSVVLSLVSRAMTAQRQGERLEIAAMLLDEQLQMVVARGADNYAQRFGLEGRCDAPFEAYGYKLAIDSGKSGEAFVVRATILWEEGSRQYSETAETLVAPRLGEEPDPERKPQEPIVR